MTTLEFAREWIDSAPKDSTIYVVQRSVAQQSKVIEPFFIADGDVYYFASLEDDPQFPFKRVNKPFASGFRVGGAQSDCTFHLVYTIGHLYRGDGYHFKAVRV